MIYNSPLLPKMVLGQVGTCIRISSSSDILFWRIQVTYLTFSHNKILKLWILPETVSLMSVIYKIYSFLIFFVQRLFFLNGEQDLSAFLLMDLGMIKFPDYVCNISHRIFQDRTDLLEYEEVPYLTFDIHTHNWLVYLLCPNIPTGHWSGTDNGWISRRK